MNQRREALWEAYLDQLRVIAGKALQVLVDDLDGDDFLFRRETAVHILKAVGLHAKGATRPKPTIRAGAGPSPEPGSPSNSKEDIPRAKAEPA